MQNILINLNIISKIKPNDKIFINDENYISIESNSIFQGLMRFIYKNSRSRNINNLNNFYECVFTHINSLVNSKYLNIIPNRLDIVNKDNNEHFISVFSELNEISIYITASIIGLNNLRQTYAADTLTVSKLDIIINAVHTHNKKIKSKLEYLDLIKEI